MQEKLRAVLVGCGRMSRAWLHACSQIDALEMVGMVDLQLALAEEQRDAFGLEHCAVSDDLEGLLRELKPDVVFDVTVPAAHRKVTLTALEHGCHVLGEKPLADSLEQAREMVEAANRSEKQYAVIQNRRYLADIRRVERALSSGCIGRLHTVNADFYLGPHFGGFREEMDHVLLLDMAIHSFDQARFLTGEDAKRVYCHEYNPSTSWFRHGASAQAIFQMTGDLTFNYRGSWCAEGLPTSWACAWRFIGEEGTLLWDGEQEVRLERVVGDGEMFRDCRAETVEPIDWPENMNGHQGLIRDFIDACQSGKPPLTHCADNIKSLEMVMAAIESAETGQPVALEHELEQSPLCTR